MLRFCPLNLRVMEKFVEVRKATREDCLEILQLIQELADFEQNPNGPKIDYEVLQKYGFDDDNPLFYSHVAVCEGKIIGYTLFFYVYTTLDRKAIHMEDLYVCPDYRKKKIGTRLFDSVAKRVFDENCQYLDFCVLSWNPAQGFYKFKGAVDLSEAEGWHAYRFTRESLNNLAAKTAAGNGEYIVRESIEDDVDSIRKLAEVAYDTQNVRISKYKKPNLKAISVINVDENIDGRQDNHSYLVVELNNKVVGYALFCYVMSTWEGLSMYLQELYVSDNDQTSNMKIDLLYAVAKTACEKDSCRLDFWVKDSKNIGKFYKANGAVDMTEIEEWHMYRLFNSN